MNPDRSHGVSRRGAIRRGLVAAAGAPLVLYPATQARAAQAKLAKSAVKYTDASADEGKDCDDCSQFVPGRTAKALGSCKIVDGAINPHGHCIAFSPKPKPKPKR